jgi:hypothetical protein
MYWKRYVDVAKLFPCENGAAKIHLLIYFMLVVSQLQNQPKSSKYVTLQFARKSWRHQGQEKDMNNYSDNAGLLDFGAWSSKGKRVAQEDAYGTARKLFDADCRL